MTTYIRCASSIEAFAAVATSPEHVADTAQYVQRLFDTKCSRPEWCFVAEQAGKAVARIALWSLPEHDTPLDFVLFNAPWDENHNAHDDVATQLLAYVEQFFVATGAKAMGHCQDTPPREPQWQTNEVARQQCLERAGFHIARHTMRYRLQDASIALALSNRLNLIALTETDDRALLPLVAQVAAASHDQLDREGCARLGARDHARELIADLREMRVDDGWWRIAHERNADGTSGAAIGFILPTASADMGTIGYAGVLPEHRGKGYVDVLIAHATQALQAAKFPRIVADTDLSNKPMAKAFERNGWICFGERLEWKKKLDPTR
jgi:ribosomal protein S18 acetylase RimI-like enzyme